MSWPKPGATTVFLATLLSAAVGAQQPSGPTFRTEINYVEFPVRALDSKGQFVRGLAQSDFQIFEDGRPQTISSFAAVDIPAISAIPAPDSPKGELAEALATNDPLRVDGRVYLFVLDDFHLKPDESHRTRTLIGQFIRERLSANDLAGVVLLSGATGVDFTQNRQLLLDSVIRFIGQDDDELSAAPGLAEYYRHVTLKTLADMADWMGAIKDRHKALVYVSATVGCDVASFGGGADCRAELQDVINAAQRADVSIYALDPGGLRTVGSPASYGGPGPFNRGGTRPTSPTPSGPLGPMRILADETGGFAVLDTNNFPRAFDRIVTENSSYYLIGYYSTNTADDGKFRKTEVRVDRKGLRLLYRAGFSVPRRQPAKPVSGATEPNGSGLEQLNALMRSPLPVSGLTLRVAAAPFLGADGNPVVTVITEMAGDAFRFTERGGHQVADVALSIGLYDSSGKSHGFEQPTIHLDIPSDRFEASRAQRFRLVAHLPTKPGSYRLWVGGLQAPDGRRGSVMTEVVVPDFAKMAPAISGLVIRSSGDDAVNVRRDEQFERALGGQPQATREFHTSDELVVYAEVYDRGGSGDRLSFEVRSQDGGIVRTGPLESPSAGPGRVARISLNSLPPGLYSTTVRLGTQSRSIQLRVVN